MYKRQDPLVLRKVRSRDDLGIGRGIEALAEGSTNLLEKHHAAVGLADEARGPDQVVEHGVLQRLLTCLLYTSRCV